MSAIEDTYSELSAAAQNTAEKNRDRRNRNQLIGLAGNIAIDYYKLGMEEKVDDFFKNAEVVKGRNVYSKAQNLNKVYGEHEANAVGYVGGEEQYVYDTFVMPYAQKIAEQEYEGWAEGFTDESKAEVLKDFANKFKDDIYNQYKNIQELRSKVDLSKNYEDFIGDSNVFPDSMGQELIGKIFGNKKNKAEVLLESKENVLKQLSPDIYALGGQEIFKSDGFEAAKTYMKGIKSSLDDQYDITSSAVKMPLMVEDGTAVVSRLVNIEQSKRDPLVVRFRDMKTNKIIPSDQLKTTYRQSREVKTRNIYTGEKETKKVYDEYAVDDDGKVYKIASTQNNEVSDAKQLLPRVSLDNDYKNLVDNVVKPYIESVREQVVLGTEKRSMLGWMEDPLNYDEEFERQANAYGQNADVYVESIGREVASELEKLSTTFPLDDTENSYGIQMGTRIVLNRRKRRVNENGEVLAEASFFRVGNTGFGGAINGLEALEAYADLATEGRVPIDENSLRQLGVILTNSGAAEQYRLLLESEDGRPGIKTNALNDLFNKPSVRTLFSRDFLENRLQSVEPEARERLINSFQKAWEEDFGQTSLIKVEQSSKKDTLKDILNDPNLRTLLNLHTEVTKAMGREETQNTVADEVEKEKVSEINARINDRRNTPAYEKRERQGTVIPDSVEDKIEYVGKLLGDNERQIQFMKRVVNQESLMGEAPGTYDFSGSEGRRGSFGVAQVDEVAFNQVQKKLKDRRNKLSKYVKPIKDAIGTDLTTVKYEDLKDDTLSIIFARMYLRQRTNAPIPKSIEKQGEYWKKYYNTFKGRGTAKEFIANNENLFSLEA